MEKSLWKEIIGGWSVYDTSNVHGFGNRGSVRPKKAKLKRPLAASQIARKIPKLSKKASNLPETVCDFCTSGLNSSGKREKLLTCKDCGATGHPSCMKYSSLLAKRALRGPWQCMNCKTCCLCDDAGKPDQMLFCDWCDHGYHMDCHKPSILKKPAGKWKCSNCELEDFNSKKQAQPRFGHIDINSVPESLIRAVSPLTCINVNLQEPQRLNSENCYPDASNWTVDDVVDYFGSVGFTEEAKTFKEQEIDGVALLLLKRVDVLRGLELKLGPALKINRHIQNLQSARKTL